MSIPTVQTPITTVQTSIPTVQTSIPTVQTSIPTVQTPIITVQTSIPHPLYDDKTINEIKEAKRNYEETLLKKKEIQLFVNKVARNQAYKQSQCIDVVSRITTNTSCGVSIFDLLSNESDWTNLELSILGLIQGMVHTTIRPKIALKQQLSVITVTVYWNVSY